MWQDVHALEAASINPQNKTHGLTTLNKPKSWQVYTNDGIITQNIFNAAVSTSVELKQIQRNYISVDI